MGQAVLQIVYYSGRVVGIDRVLLVTTEGEEVHTEVLFDSAKSENRKFDSRFAPAAEKLTHAQPLRLAAFVFLCLDIVGERGYRQDGSFEFNDGGRIHHFVRLGYKSVTL